MNIRFRPFSDLNLVTRWKYGYYPVLVVIEFCCFFGSLYLVSGIFVWLLMAFGAAGASLNTAAG